MWLEWIVEVGKSLFDTVSLWMEELLFLDDTIEEDIFLESVLHEPNENIEKEESKVFFQKIQELNEEEQNFSMQNTIWNEVDAEIPTEPSTEEYMENRTTSMQEVDGGYSSFYEAKVGLLEKENKANIETNEMWINEFSDDAKWSFPEETNDSPQKSIELQQIQLLENEVEKKTQEDKRKSINNETKVVEKTATEIDINLLMEEFEKRLWASRQKGCSRLIQR